MSTNFYELLKYAAAGIASPVMSYYDRMRASTLMGGTTVQTLTGQPPLSFPSDGSPITIWNMKGNGRQTGTPSPDNIIMPTFCGVRTGNLWDSGDVTIALHERYKSIPISLEQGVYTLSFEYKSENTGTVTVIFYNENTIIQSFNVTITNDKGTTSITSTQPITAIRLYSASGYTPSYDYTAEYTNIMLNSSSTALPYEPYGWKIPFENHVENLFDAAIEQGSFRIIDGTTQDSTTRVRSQYMDHAISAGTYTISASGPHYVVVYAYTTNNASGYDASESTTAWKSVPYTFTTTKPLYLRFGFRKYGDGDTIVPSDVSNIMLTLGSSPKPYSPYLNETIPVYLGEVPTVRRVRKLVLDGTENWYINESVSTEDTAYFYTTVITSNTYVAGYAICSHFEYKDVFRILDVNGFHLLSGYGGLRFRIMRTIAGTVADFKSYLAQQYANGTPVTVWYVLATPETGIVNEPLRKIGDYADELSSTDAAVTIPTAKGQNTLTVETELQPSEMTITYKG